VRPVKPWLCQGDLFENVPRVLVRQLFSGDIDSVVDPGAALLLSEGCQIDKRKGNGQPNIPRLVFAPVNLLSASGLDGNIVSRLRNYEIAPPGAVYIPDVGDGNEGVALLSEAYPIPAPYFSLASENFALHPESDPADPHHVVARSNAARLSTMDDAELRVMHDKMTTFWTFTHPPISND
jgi:hypothetical protein